MPFFDHFKIFAPIYDRVFGIKDEDELVNLAALENPSIILDVGGGTGRASLLFLDDHHSVYVVDESLNMLREARKKGLNCVNAVSEKLPFRTNRFDLILMVDAFHHVADHTKTLKELTRMTSSAGMAILEEPDIQHWFVKLIALVEKLLLMRSQFHTPDWIAKKIKQITPAKVSILRKKGIAWIIMDKNT